MHRHRVVTPALKSILVSSSSARRGSSMLSYVDPATPSSATIPSSGGVRRRPWEGAVLKSCAARKQIRVSLDAVLEVSTGKRPWRSSFGEANPEVQPGAEPEFARPACNNYVQDRESRKLAEGQLQSAQYLHRELPVRLASAVTELDKMTDTGLTDALPTARVRENYLQSFRELQETQRPHDRDSVESFTATVDRVHQRDSDTVLLMACGLRDLMRGRGGSGGGRVRKGADEGEELERVQDFLDHFYQNRVAMRFLCGHYLALSSPPRKGFVGLVQRGVSLTNIAQAAAMEAASICCSALGACPEVRMSVDRSGDGLVAAVPEYVHYVVLEVLKNAMRATMQAHGKGESESERREGVSTGGGGGDGVTRRPIVFADVPEVSISVRKRGADDLLLVVGDHGGGIPAEATDKVWSYLYTTAGDAVRNAYLANGGNSPGKPAPLAGLGYGLPLSRLYARNFGGELMLHPAVDRQGTDAVLCLSRHGTRLEPLVWPSEGEANDGEIDSNVHL